MKKLLNLVKDACTVRSNAKAPTLGAALSDCGSTRRAVCSVEAANCCQAIRAHLN